MATNYVGPGDVVNLPAPTGGVTSGDLVPFPAIGATQKLVGLAHETAAAGVTVAFTVWGVVRGTKATGVTFAIGDDLYLDSSSELTTTATANGFVGIAMSVEASGSTTANVLINTGGDPR